MERLVVTEALEPASPRSTEGSIPSDRADVRAAAAGDRQAFDRLVLRHQQAVIDAASYYLGNYQDALEVAQEAFIKAYRALERFRGDAQFRTWMLRITMNAARSFQTKRRAKKRSAPIISIHSRGAGTDDDDDAGFEIPDYRDTPESLLHRKELKEMIERAIAELDEEARELIVLRDIVGESYDAIAEQFDLPLGTVKSKVHRARLVLREKISKFL
jgi:RNA polymerase sigma-70 factor (ECF subfamily)